MSVITNAIQFIIDLGPTVMMPILITLIGVCIRVPFLRALKGGLLVGIGFIGLNATVTILTDVVQPAVDNMVKLFGLNLTVIDVGWPSASAIAFGTAVGVTMIPLGILINVIMLLTKSTKTVDVDIWDFWHFAFSGSIVYALTHNMFLSLILASVNMVVIMVIADRMAKATEEVLGLPGITFPHGLAASFVPIAWVMDKAIDKVPGLNKIHLDEKTINKKMGLFGDPAILGLIVGVLLGVAGFAFMPELSVSEKISQILVMASPCRPFWSSRQRWPPSSWKASSRFPKASRPSFRKNSPDAKCTSGWIALPVSAIRSCWRCPCSWYPSLCCWPSFCQATSSCRLWACAASASSSRSSSPSRKATSSARS